MHWSTLLGQLNAAGRSVICSIHQPRAKIFELFDKALLLTQGRTSYYGDRAEIGPFLASAGWL
jgi:ABC-type multidrug transport system ATPase subunit